MIHVGNKYYKYVNDELEVVRIGKFQNESEVKVRNLNTGLAEKKSIKELENEYRLLLPDGYITFMVVNLKEELHDVIVTLTTTEQVKANAGAEPYCVCRQCITDLHANQIRVNNAIYYGACISQETCPVDVDFSIMLACNGVVSMEMIAIYIDDKLDDIFPMIDVERYDHVLISNFYDHVKFETRNLGNIAYKNYIKLDSFQGYCKNLKDLLNYNNFMYDFYRAFNIVSLDIDLFECSPNSISLSEYNGDRLLIKILERLLCVNMGKVIIFSYDKDIDLSQIQNEYILVSDKNDDLFIVTYETYGKYELPIEDIESQENIQKITNAINNKTQNNIVYDHLKLNKDKYQ